MKRILSAVATIILLFACTPETVHVTGLSLDKTSITIKEGEQFTLVPTVIPENADNTNVIWSTISEAVATVDNDGKVTGIRVGSASITATTEDGGMTATCVVTVESNLAPSVTEGSSHISAISAVLMGKANIGSSVASDLKVGFQYSTSAGILPSNSTTVEASEADANFNYSTVITGLEPATKYYFRSFVRQNGIDTYGDTKEFITKEFASLLETKGPTEIKASSATLNAKLDLTDVHYYSLSYGFYWGTSETSQNTNRVGGEIIDNAYSSILNNLSHKTQYWYKAYVKLDGQTCYGDVRTFTTDVVKVESVTLDKSEYTFKAIGQTLILKATVLPSDATDQELVWSSSNEEVATVDQNGRVRAIGNGSAIITVMTKGQTKTATCDITVAQSVTGVSFNKTYLELNEGEEEALLPTVNPANANNQSLTWTSSETSVATVDANGRVTAISKGTATIKAEANDGSNQYASCMVVVNRLVSSIELDKTTLTLYRGDSDVTERIAANVLPTDASNTSVTWTSSNPSVATVSVSGVVTGMARGSVTITATAKDGSGISAACDVEVKQYVTNIRINKTSLSLVEGGEEALSVTSILPDNANNKTLTWTSTNTSVATVDANGKVTAISKGTATIKVAANDGSGFIVPCKVTVYELMVDLGLPSGIKWASSNVCEAGFENSPEGYGDYYVWGDVEPYYSSKDPLTWRSGKSAGFVWTSYKWCDGSSSTITKYCTSGAYGDVDNKTVLEEDDDVAHVKLGGSWRTPTDEEWNELLTKCTWQWIIQNGVKGYMVTGVNSNSIFLPAAGLGINATIWNVGSVGYYWSSSLAKSAFNGAWYVLINDTRNFMEEGSRISGQSVRPVKN